MERLGKFISFFILCLLSAPSFAELKHKSYLSSNNIEIGDVVAYTIELISDKKMRQLGEGFVPPSLKGLDFQDISTSSSTSMSYSNGSVSRSYTMTYSLNYVAESAGLVKFPPLDLKLPERIKTQALTLKVFKTLPPKLRPRSKVQSGNLIDQIFGRRQRANQAADNRPLEFFTRVEIDKTDVYKGEQLVATWYIYVTPGASLGTFDTLSFPTLKGFWKEDVNFASRFYWKNVTVDGKKYMRALLSSYALTPYKAGDHIIDPFELRTVITKGFFNGRRKVLKAESEPIAINVKPLPQTVPETFLGGVGRFKTDSVRSSQTRDVYTGEAFEISFRVVGDEATTKFLKTPDLDVGDMFKIYKVKEEHKFVASKVSSYKFFKYSLIPKKEGVYRFPDLKLSFLDPSTGEYYDEYVKLPTYKVRPSRNGNKIVDEVFEDAPLSPDELKASELSALSYRPFGEDSHLVKFIYFRLHSLWTLVILMLGVLGSLLIFKKQSFAQIQKENLAVELEKRALRVADLLQDNKRNDALSELINILSILVGAVNGKRFGAEKEIEMAVKSLPTSLKSSGVKLKNLNDQLQEMRFGSSLESYTNKARLETCLKEFKVLFLEFREYLR